LRLRPTADELPNRCSVVETQIEKLSRELAQANDDVFLLQDQKVISRCNELRGAIEATRAVTIPSLKQRRQELMAQVYDNKLHAGSWDEEQARTKR